MTNRSKTLKIRVTPEEKSKILDYMDESKEADSISDFGRLVILRYIHNKTSEDSGGESLDQEKLINSIEVANSDLTERLESIEDQVARLASRTKRDEEAEDLAHQLKSDLKPVEPGKSLPNTKDIAGPLGKDLKNAQNWGTATAWGKYYDEDTDLVRRALVVAEDWFPAVDYHAEGNGTLRYYRRTDTSDDYYIPARLKQHEVKRKSEIEDNN